MKRGRPTVITEEMLVIILQVIGDGLSWADAATYVGLKSKSSIRDEAKRNPEFSHALRKSELDGKLHHLRRIKGGEDRWQSAAWFLERKYPKEFSVKVSAQPQVTTPVPLVVEKYTNAVR